MPVKPGKIASKITKKKSVTLHADSVFDFQGVLQKSAHAGGWPYVLFPHDVEEIFGTRSHVRMIGTYNGIPIERALIPGGGQHHLSVSSEMRRKAKIRIGDVIHFVLQRDPDPKKITYPEELEAAFELSPEFQNAFCALSPGRQRSYIHWISSGKQEMTRAKRAAEFLRRFDTGHEMYQRHKNKNR